MKTMITNGTIVNADATTTGDVLVDGEQIALIGTDLAASTRPIGPSMPAASG